MSLLSIQALNVTMAGRHILKDASLSLARGELLGLVGPNGAGKSTLLKTLAGLIAPDSGQLTLAEAQLDALPRDQRARQIAYLAQERTAHWPLTVQRIVALGRFPHLADWQQPSEADRAIIDRAIIAADIDHLRQRRFNTLSGGEGMRVLLARALAVDADVLLADEPISALDPAHALSVMQLLRDTCERGHAVIAVLHDLTLAARFCHQLVLLHQGEVIAHGAPQDVLNDTNLRRAYHVTPWQAGEDDAIILPWHLCKPDTHREG